ncbi:MAG: diaminopimelate epimerase [Thermodesulfobacteriota bacterium]
MTDITSLLPLAGIEIVKMTGTGNDFVLVDNRQAQVPPALMPLLAKAVCQRRRSVGADGLVLLEPSDRVDPERGRVDFRWHFFNSDGSAAEMCGNAGRCAARFAHDRGLAGEQMVFDTIAGPIRAWLKGGGEVKLEMIRPFDAYRDLELTAGGRALSLAGINSGVPHTILAVEDLEAVPVRELGRELRFHPHFAPAGTNVNFVAAGDGELLVRTYERGVEDETLACGTGAVASALMTGPALGLASPVKVRVRSGETLKVYFEGQGDSLGPVFLEGAASYVFQGTLLQDAFAWLQY